MPRQADVVVVGMGIAGACAALSASAAGASVLVIERAGSGGGTSAMSSGIFYLGGGTALQRDLGVEDDPDEMYRYMLASCGVTDAGILKRFCDGCTEHFDWLEAQGIPFRRSLYADKHMCPATSEGLLSTGNEKVWPYREIARPALRGHRVDREGDNAGLPAMEALLARCAEAGVEILRDTTVKELVTDPAGRVIGASCRRFGETFAVLARRGLILATGGFQMNHEMIADHAGFLLGKGQPIGSPYSDGSGIVLAQQIGAAVTSMDAVHATASFYPPSQLICGIIVNVHGQRFVAEDSYHGRTAAHVFEQPGQKAWLILDSESFAYPELAEFFRYELVDGWESVADMERGLGMGVGSLEQTISEYNRDAAAGRDSRFGKYIGWLKPLDKPPFAAFDLSLGSAVYHYHTLGGLKVDAEGRVIDLGGAAIPGLFAAGSCAATIVETAKGYASGMTLSSGSFFGRLAGAAAAAG
jgi:succinate dehydrogenase/fumarate reductase flavoprotein subunit